MLNYPDYGDMYLPNSERLCQELISFSQTYLLGTREDMDDIVHAVKKVKENVDELR